MLEQLVALPLVFEKRLYLFAQLLVAADTI
jgi:hypothetical protein